jgi:hypothetical protein
MRGILTAGFIALVSALGPASAQSSPPAELVKARNAFASAVAANNSSAAAELSSFPLINRVYREPRTTSKAGFAGLFKSYRQNFSKCLKSEPLKPEQTPAGKKTGLWTVDCDGNIVLFGQKSGRWLHVGFENVNE